MKTLTKEERSSDLTTISGYRQALAQVESFLKQKLEASNVPFPEKTAYQTVYAYIQKHFFVKDLQ